MRLAFITPPFIKPSEPGLSAEAAAGWFRARGVDAFAVDASIAWFHHTLRRESLEGALAEAERRGGTAGTLQAFRQVRQKADALCLPLQRPETYQQRRVYSSAVSRLTTALRLASVPHPAFQLRLADVEAVGRRPQDSRDLEAIGSHPTPFDAYFTEVLLPQMEAENVTHVAVSLTFLHQAFAAFRLAFLLRERLPRVQRILGGPLVACWSAVGADLDTPSFRWFDRIVETASEIGMNALAAELGGTPRADRALLAPDLARTPWADYLVPMPTVPVALGRGCYWRRCTFCPDYLHPAYQPCSSKGLAHWLEAVAARFPQGAMLHLTDSALSPALLGRIADVIKERSLPLRWHGFVRLEARFAEAGFARHLAEGGCAMLQWGLETASPRLLELMDKGITAEQARQALRRSAEAGIKNHAYLLFGLPTETEADRDATLAFVRQESASLHDLNASILNLPRRSPMHDEPQRYGITHLSAFGSDTDLSLYADFRCGDSHPRVEARRWLGARFLKDPTVKELLGDLNAPFKENHSCFLPRR
jgi:hypothetical protein